MQLKPILYRWKIFLLKFDLIIIGILIKFRLTGFDINDFMEKLI